MQVRESLFRDTLRLVTWFPFRWLIHVVSVSRAFALYRAAGRVHGALSPGRRARLAGAMQRSLGLDVAAAARAAARIFELHYLDRLHILLYPRLTDWKILKPFVVFENLGVLDAALSEGKGALLVQPHFGPVQITLLALALRGYEPLQIGFPSDDGLSAIGRKVAYHYRLRYEAMLPAPIIAADGYLGAVYKRLLRGGVVLTTGDGAGGSVFLGEHRRFRFLGTERMIPLGPAALALRTKAAYIPTFIIPERHDRFRIVFGEPIASRRGAVEADKVDMTGRFLATAEEQIRRHPECWHFWDELV
jgi:KDO2-lipid IV(A) lauroyltransferase